MVMVVVVVFFIVIGWLCVLVFHEDEIIQFLVCAWLNLIFEQRLDQTARNGWANDYKMVTKKKILFNKSFIQFNYLLRMLNLQSWSGRVLSGRAWSVQFRSTIYRPVSFILFRLGFIMKKKKKSFNPDLKQYTSGTVNWPNRFETNKIKQ